MAQLRVLSVAAEAFPLPPPPTAGIVCPCAGVGVDDLQGVWDRGFTELELVKRASLAGTGTCQGSACMPHVRAWIAARTGAAPEPFTARPASRQITLAEAAADMHIDAFRRTPLHDEHVALGAQMDRFGYLNRAPKHRVVPEDPAYNAPVLRATAEDSAVLLKNQDGVLPLSRSDLDSVAFIGPGAGQTVAIGQPGEKSLGIPSRQVGPLARVSAYDRAPVAD